MKRSTVVLLCLSLWPASSAWAAGPVDIDVQLGTWIKDVSGDVKWKGDGIDVDSDLGLGDDTSLYARGRLHVIALGNFYASYAPLEHTGDKVLSRTITFGDRTFSGGAVVASKIDLDMYDIAWTTTPISFPTTELEVGVNVKYIDGTVSVREGATAETADMSVPVPMLKAALRFDVPFVTVELDGAGIAYGGNHFYDLSAQVKITPVMPFYISGGYRLLDLELEDGDQRAAIKTGGPFLGLGFDL